MAQNVALANFLQESAARKFEPGVWDCGLWLADWLMVARGVPDPCPELRFIDGKIWASKSRFLVRVVTQIAERAGLHRTEWPKPGAIGVLRVDAAFVGSISTARGWAVLTTKGVACGPLQSGARLMRAWAV